MLRLDTPLAPPTSLPLHMRVPRPDVPASPSRVAALRRALESRSIVLVDEHGRRAVRTLCLERRAIGLFASERICSELAFYDLVVALGGARGPYRSSTQLLARALDLVERGGWTVVVEGAEIVEGPFLFHVLATLTRHLEHGRVILVADRPVADAATPIADDLRVVLPHLESDSLPPEIHPGADDVRVGDGLAVWLAASGGRLPLDVIHRRIDPIAPLAMARLRETDWVTIDRGDVVLDPVLSTLLAGRPDLASAVSVGWSGTQRDHGTIDRFSQRVRGSEGWLDLSRRNVLWSLVEALVDAGASGADKEALIDAVWAPSEYHPLRHDNRLRLAVRRLRGLLDAADPERWVETTDAGYRWRPAAFTGW